MSTLNFDWTVAEIGAKYDVIGYVLYPPVCKNILGRDRGDRKQYRMKLYNTVQQYVELFIETQSLDSEVYLNIAANFEGVICYIEDCEALSADTFQVSQDKITLSVLNLENNKINFQKFQKNPKILFDVDISLSTNSIETFICPDEMLSFMQNFQRLHRLRKMWMQFPAKKMEKIQSFMARDIFYREHKTYIEEIKIADRVFEIDPYKYLGHSKLVKSLLYNHIGQIQKIDDFGCSILLLVGEYHFILPKKQFPGVVSRVKLNRLVAFPFNVKIGDEKNRYTLKYDEMLTLVDDMESLRAVQQVIFKNLNRL